LGPGGIEHVTVGVLRRLGLGGRLFVRTRRHPAVADLEAMGFACESMDDLYETIPDYDTLYRTIAERLVAAAQGRYDGVVGPPPRRWGEQPAALDREIIYAVPGHPTVAEDSVHLAVALAQEAGVLVEVVPGLSWLDAAWAELRLDPTGRRGLAVVDALDDSVPFQAARSYLVSHVYHPLVAGALKIRLMEAFPDDHRVTVLRAGAATGERRAEVPLRELDRLPWLDHLASVWVPARAAAGEPTPGEPASAGPAPRRSAYPLDSLVGVMARLRGEDGCPWDREQTHQSLKPYAVEEAYEVWDAVDDGDPEKLCDELGDLLLQVVFQAQIADEAGTFDLNGVVRGIVAKLVRRHPHVFGDVTVSDAGEVVMNWERIKRSEEVPQGRRSALEGIPRHLPSLLTAGKIQEKAARAGFEWPSLGAAARKVWEEAREVRRAYGACRRPVAAGAEAEVKAEARVRLEEEVGDLLFAVVNVARMLHVNAEAALRRTVVKFARRLEVLEELARAEGKQLSQLPPDRLLDLWGRAKREE
jgi:tetrapyrrole methylase family protein/MazG family protein